MSCLNSTKTFPLSPGEYTIKALAEGCYLICDPIIGILQNDTEIQIPVNTNSPDTELWTGGGRLNSGSKFRRVESDSFGFANNSNNDVKEIRIESKPIRYVVSYTDSIEPDTRTWMVDRYCNYCCKVDDRVEDCPTVQDEDDGVKFSGTVLKTDDFVQDVPSIPLGIDTWIDPHTNVIWRYGDKLCELINDDIMLVPSTQEVLTVQYDPDEIVDSGSNDINVEEVPPV